MDVITRNTYYMDESKTGFGQTCTDTDNLARTQILKSFLASSFEQTLTDNDNEALVKLDTGWIVYTRKNGFIYNLQA